jgi:polysaccharide export outer membrane protein
MSCDTSHIRPQSAPTTAVGRPCRCLALRFDWFLVILIWLLFVLIAFASEAADDTSAFVVIPPTLKSSDGAGTNKDAGLTMAPVSELSATAITNQLKMLDDKYQLAIGDELSFRIIEDEDDPKLLTVMDSGELEVPYIGRFPGAGKTCKQLAQQLKVELEKTYYWHATVIIAVNSKPKSRGKIYIVGAIGAPGAIDISGDETMTVSKAVLRAGAFTAYSDGQNVRITRTSETHPGETQNFTVNVNSIFEKGKVENDLPVRPGDLIFVPERMIRF